jgi:hypothetical protein
MQARSILIGVSSGVGVGLLGLVGFLCWYHFQARSARRRLDQAIAETEKEDPQLLPSWGGPAVLRDRLAVEGVLRTVEG